MKIWLPACAGMLLLLGCSAGRAQAAPSSAESGTAVRRDIDSQLMQVIQSTAASDTHAHPVLSPPADATDREFDALPVDNMAPETDPVAWRADWPALHDAWQALYGVDIKPPLTTDSTKQLEAARTEVKTREGVGYSALVL